VRLELGRFLELERAKCVRFELRECMQLELSTIVRLELSTIVRLELSTIVRLELSTIVRLELEEVEIHIASMRSYFPSAIWKTSSLGKIVYASVHYALQFYAFSHHLSLCCDIPKPSLSSSNTRLEAY